MRGKHKCELKKQSQLKKYKFAAEIVYTMNKFATFLTIKQNKTKHVNNNNKIRWLSETAN